MRQRSVTTTNDHFLLARSGSSRTKPLDNRCYTKEEGMHAKTTAGISR
jgi:hypothetical protein